MLSHVEKRTQSFSAAWKVHIQSKTVVFVGEAAGMGRDIAVMLAAHGAPVFLAAHNMLALKQAFVAINRAGGECDGMVVDWTHAEEIRRFFMLAEAWLGGLDVVVTPLVQDGPAAQNLCMQEAIRRMHAVGRGHIIHIDLPKEDGLGDPVEQQVTAALRRQARQLGLHVTLIQAGARPLQKSGVRPDRPAPQEIARCVLESITQPFKSESTSLPAEAGPAH